MAGKTYRDDKSTVIVYHVSPEKLSALQPLSKFGPYTGAYVSPSYRSIIEDWIGVVMNRKKDHTELERLWNENNREIDALSDNFKDARNPVDQGKLDELFKKREKINNSMSKEGYKNLQGYKTIYIHKIACPRDMYKECQRIFREMYDSGYRKNNMGFWGWGDQIFIPKEFLRDLEMLSIEELNEGEIRDKYKSFMADRSRHQRPKLKLTPEEEKKFEEEESRRKIGNENLQISH